MKQEGGDARLRWGQSQERLRSRGVRRHSKRWARAARLAGWPASRRAVVSCAGLQGRRMAAPAADAPEFSDDERNSAPDEDELVAEKEILNEDVPDV